MRLVACVGFIIVLAAAPCAAGEEPLYGTSRTMDPRALGLAGASLATPSSVSGLYLNPATIAMAHIYHLNLMYQYTGQEDLHMGGIAIVDSVTSSTIAAGLAVNLNLTGETLPDLAQSYTQMGKVYFKLDQDDKAVEYFRRASDFSYPAIGV